MKIKRFVAAGMRQAMQQVRDEQGPDAVILSTRRFEEGIEIIAAIDYDEALVREAAVHAMPSPVPPAAERLARAEPAVTHEVLAQLARTDGGESSPALSSMRQELGSLREMLETQLASLAWNDMNRRNPVQAGVLRQLTRMEIDADIAQEVAEELPPGLSSEQARYLPLGLLARRVATSGRQLSTVDGVVAVVGPTGVGKTTTLAKLAAHAVLHHGAGRVALISTDHYRIGAGAQLGHYARLLGVPVYEVHEAGQLHALLARLDDRRTILVDSAGMGAHDPRLAGQLNILRAAQPRMCPILVLAANAHAQALDEAAQAYLPLQPGGCILTKLDEAPRLGGALSVLIRHGLRLEFTTAGQRVPEDIAAADVRQLVCRAANNPPAGNAGNEIELAERFGRMTSAEA
ncbi:MAG TPA: flagellar biosynthesis protein FlhF [Rhodanobacteraceae bacterium]|nr:flagellar biosynthesis protein FlhF [Rhodanobacteraceae bacterium]